MASPYPQAPVPYPPPAPPPPPSKLDTAINVLRLVKLIGIIVFGIIFIAAVIHYGLTEKDDNIGDDGTSGITWNPPASVTVSEFEVLEAEEALRVRAQLWDSDDYVTMADGSLTVIIRDSLGYTLCQETFYLREEDYRVDRTVVGGKTVIDVWYEVRIPFSGLRMSKDRLEVYDPDLDEYIMRGTMMALGRFEDDTGVTVIQDPDDLFARMTETEIPDALLLPNVDPIARCHYQGPAYATVPYALNATGTQDDLPLSTLTFEWSWPDTGMVEEAGATVEHAFKRPGTFQVALNVTDAEGRVSSTNVTVTVEHPVELLSRGSGVEADPGNHTNDAYIVVTMHNRADVNVSIDHMLPKAWDSRSVQGTYTGLDREIGEWLQPDDELTIRLYFKGPQGWTLYKVKLWDCVTAFA